MKRLILLIFLMTFLFGCSYFRNVDQQNKEEMLRKNLSYLNKFKAEGIVDVSTQGLSFRKEFKLQKNQNQLRLDVINSGLMSFFPSPFASLYVENNIILTNHQQGMFPDLILNNLEINKWIDLEKLPQDIIKEIVENQEFNLAPLKFKFDALYRLIQVSFTEEKIVLIYNHQDLAKITYDSAKYRLELQFDNYIPGEYSIKPLTIKNN